MDLGGTVKPAETTPAWHRFRVTIEPEDDGDVHRRGDAADADAGRGQPITDDQIALLVRDEAISRAARGRAPRRYQRERPRSHV